MERPYSRITLTLPTFVIIALREVVKEMNAAAIRNPHVSVSKLVEEWLLQIVAADNKSRINAIAKRSPEFRRQAEAWIRWATLNEQERR
jgi:hypothetical protein